MASPDPVAFANQAVSEVDPAISPWDDPLGIGFAATGAPGGTYAQVAWTNANRAVFHRFISGGVINFLRGRVATQSGNWDMAIYANTGSGENSRPGPAIWRLGSTPVPAAANFSVSVPSVTVQARKHWLGFACDNTTASFVLYSGLNQFIPYQGWMYFLDSQFPLPDPAPALTIANSGVNRHMLLVGSRT